MKNKFSNNSVFAPSCKERILTFRLMEGMLGHELYLEIMDHLRLLMIKAGVLRLVKLEHATYLKESLFVNQFYECYIVMNN